MTREPEKRISLREVSKAVGVGEFEEPTPKQKKDDSLPPTPLADLTPVGIEKSLHVASKTL